MARLRLLDLFGVTTSGEASLLWPREHVGASLGATVGDVDLLFATLIEELNSALELHAFRPGAEKDRVGFSASVRVTQPVTHPLVAATMPDVGIYLEPTGHLDAHLFVTHGPDASVGREVVIHGLPIRLSLPLGLLAPGIVDDPDGTSLLPVRVTDAFDPDRADSLEITLSNSEPSTIRVRANLRLTRTGDVILQPVVPLSIGACRFSGIPCQGLHDVQLFPTLRLGYVPDTSIRAELPLKWLRYRAERAIAPLAYPSAIAIRTIDLDPTWPTYKDLQTRMLARRAEQSGENPGDLDVTAIDIVVEDILLPLGLGVPLPLHGRLALRRRILTSDAGDIYNLDSAPARFDLGDTQLIISRLLVQTQVEDGLPAAFTSMWVKTDDPLANLDELPAGVMSLTEEPALEGGMTFGEGHRKRLFTVAGTDAKLAAIRVGAVLKDLNSSSFAKAFFFLADLELDVPASSDKPVELRKSGGEPGYMLLRGVGWKGGPAFGSLYDPSGLDLVALRSLKLKITELGLVGLHGKRYLSISASAEHGSSDGATEWSIALRHLRLRLDDDPPPAPLIEVEGIEISYKSPTTTLLGFGMLSDYDRDGTRFHELGFEIKVATTVLDKTLELGAQYLRGTARGNQNFDYWLFGFSVGELSLGSTLLYRGEVMLVRNLAPALPPPTGDEPALQLFNWYKAQGNPLSLPLNRKLDTWHPADGAMAIGIGATIQLAATSAVQLGGFFFYREDAHEKGLLGGLELHLFKAETPAAFLIYEHDFARHRYTIAGGLDLSIDKLLGSHIPHWLDLLHISGSGLFCNKPDTLAIGQYPDPTTWLAIRFDWKHHFDLRIAFCYHRVDDPDPSDPGVERINALAFTVTIKGSWEIAAVASGFQLYGSFELRRNQWRTSALAAGTTMTAEIAVRLKLFGWFRFGASVQVEIAHLGPEGETFTRRSLVIRIETPWYLPDVTIRWECTDGDADPSSMLVCARPLSSASALDVHRRATQLAISERTNLPSTTTAPTYSLTQLRASTVVATSDDVFATLEPVATDATIVLDLGTAADASATVLPPSPAGASAQQSGELHARYEVVSIGIRRKARFGPQAAVWHDLLDPTTTQLPPLDQLPGNLTALFTSAVRVAWDADATRLGRLDPRRLLINADTPYTFTTGNPSADEDLATSHPRWPCCLDTGRKPVWHALQFPATQLGLRSPSSLTFTDSRSILRWTGTPPVIVPAHAMSNAPAAGLLLGSAPVSTLAIINFDEPVAAFELTAAWTAQQSHAVLRIDAYRGAELVSSTMLAASSAVAGVPPVHVQDARGITHVVLRKLGAVESMPASVGAITPIVAMRYQTVREALATAILKARCDAADAAVHGEGAMAWLPNHDYEVALQMRVVVEHEGSGSQDTVVEERAQFRTKGPPGLNAAPNVGDELAPYVESVYPAPGTLLYREEPIVLAFDERWSRYALVDRVLSPSDPAERQQIIEWDLAVELDTSNVPLAVTATGPDWILGHRGHPLPPGPPFFDGLLIRGHRRVASLEPRQQRFDAMVSRPNACGAGPTLRASSVLVQSPPPSPAGAAWAGDSTYDVHLRARGAPYVNRQPFAPEDATSLIFASLAATPAIWLFDDGALRPQNATTRAFASFGETTWDHVTATVAIASEASGGLALGVDGTSIITSCVYAMLVRDSVAGDRLDLVEVVSGSERILATSPIAPSAAPASTLTVSAFDDRWRAEAGDVRVEAPRDTIRAGRIALVADPGGGVSALMVHGLDAYRLRARTSRWRNFADHVATFAGTAHLWNPDELGGAPSTVASLLAGSGAAITEAMAPGSDPESRQRMFDGWLDQLALPQRSQVTRLEVTRYMIGLDTHAFLIESPEPLPIGEDISLTLHQPAPPSHPPHPPPHPPHPFPVPDPLPPHAPPQPHPHPLPPHGPPQPHPHPHPLPPHWPPHPPAPVVVRHVALRNGDQTRVLIVPVTSAGASLPTRAPTTFDLALNRSRYRAQDPAATCSATATIVIP